MLLLLLLLYVFFKHGEAQAGAPVSPADRLQAHSPCAADHQAYQVHRQQPQQLEHASQQLLPGCYGGWSIRGCGILLQQPVHGWLCDSAEQQQAVWDAVRRRQSQ